MITKLTTKSYPRLLHITSPIIAMSIAISIAIISLGNTAYAKTPSLNQSTITLDGFVAVATENASNVRIAEADSRSAIGQLIGGTSPLLPRVNIRDTQFLHSATPAQAALVEAQGDHNTQLSVSMSLFNGFGNVIGLYAAYQGASAASDSLVAAKEDARFNAQTTYIAALRARDNLKVAQEAEIMSKEQLANSQNLFRSGLITKSERLNSEVNYLSSQQNTSLAQLNYNASIYNMENLVLQTLPYNVKLTNIPIPRINNYSYSQLEEMMINNRSELLALSKASNAQTSLVYRSISNFLPTASLSYTKSLQGDSIASPGDLLDQQESVAFVINFDLFKGFANVASQQTANANAYRAKHQLIALIQTMRTQLKTSLETYSIRKELYNTAEKKLETAELSYQDASRQYKEGVITQIQLLQSFTNLVNSQREFNNAKYDIILSIFQLERATQTVLRVNAQR